MKQILKQCNWRKGTYAPVSTSIANPKLNVTNINSKLKQNKIQKGMGGLISGTVRF